MGARASLYGAAKAEPDLRCSGRGVDREAGGGVEQQHRWAVAGETGGFAGFELLVGRQFGHEQKLPQGDVREALVAQVFDKLDRCVKAKGAVRGQAEVDVLGSEAGEQ